MHQRSSLLFFVIIFVAVFSVQAQTRNAPGTSQPVGKQNQPDSAAATKGAENGQGMDDCGCEIQLSLDVMAMVNGVKITTREIDEVLKARITALEQQVSETRKRELYLQINSRLLEAEAGKRGISSAQLLKDEVIAKIAEPTETEAQAFYEQNKSRFQADFKDVKETIFDLLRGQRQGDEAKKLADRLRAGAQVKVLVAEAAPPKTAADRQRVLAVVNGENITSGDVEESLSVLIHQVREQVYKLRQQELDLRINDTLLQQEALKRQMTASALLDAEVMPKVRKIGEAEARTFYEQNKSRIAGEFDQVKGQLIPWLQEMENRNTYDAYAAQLRKSANVQVFLTPPEQPVYAISVADQPARGAETAPVTIVEFTDYECPSCAQTRPILEQLLKEYDGRVRLVVRDFPLQQHTSAFKAAEAAEAARAQGKFWPYHELLFQHQKSLTVEQLKTIASQLGLDLARFSSDLTTGRYAGNIQRDLQEGSRLGINSTPTIFINGRLVAEKSYESLKAAIEEALNNNRKQ